jgi:hypothetical protein
MQSMTRPKRRLDVNMPTLMSTDERSLDVRNARHAAFEVIFLLQEAWWEGLISNFEYVGPFQVFQYVIIFDEKGQLEFWVFQPSWPRARPEYGNGLSMRIFLFYIYALVYPYH